MNREELRHEEIHYRISKNVFLKEKYIVLSEKESETPKQTNAEELENNAPENCTPITGKN